MVRARCSAMALSWKAGLFHTLNTNDIIALASTITGQGYYANVPATLRQGVEACSNSEGHLSAYVSYAIVDATYRFTGNSPRQTIHTPTPMAMCW